MFNCYLLSIDGDEPEGSPFVRVANCEDHQEAAFRAAVLFAIEIDAIGTATGQRIRFNALPYNFRIKVVSTQPMAPKIERASEKSFVLPKVPDRVKVFVVPLAIAAAFPIIDATTHGDQE